MSKQDAEVPIRRPRVMERLVLGCDQYGMPLFFTYRGEQVQIIDEDGLDIEGVYAIVIWPFFHFPEQGEEHLIKRFADKGIEFIVRQPVTTEESEDSQHPAPVHHPDKPQTTPPPDPWSVAVEEY